MLNLKPELKAYEKGIGKVILKLFPKVKTVCTKSGSVRGDLRLPQIRRIAGNGTITTHTENGCRYRLDVAKVMFAKGNSGERARLPGLVKPGETIVDMFAGIGYFAIPIAVHANPKKIFAIEKNPASVKFLRENTRLNGISCIDVTESDNRNVSLPDVADRVIMGYLPGTERFLPAAFGFLKNNGTIHFHNTCKKDDLWNKPVGLLGNAAEDAGYMLDKIMHKGVVKHFSPGTEHIVIDARFRKSS